MLRAKRPFDQKPAASCLTCGTSIAGGDYCLSCIPPSTLEGPNSWVNHRWFSGPEIEAKKRRQATRENLQRGATGLMALAAALLLFALAPLHKPHFRSEENMLVAQRHSAKTPLKLQINGINIA
jgi:hypothetical protein